MNDQHVITALKKKSGRYYNTKKKVNSSYWVIIFLIQIRRSLIGAKGAIIHSFTNLGNKGQVWTCEQDTESARLLQGNSSAGTQNTLDVTGLELKGRKKGKGPT